MTDTAARRRRSGVRRVGAALAALGAGLALAGCSTTSGSVDTSTRFVAGDGSTVLLSPDQRDAAPSVTGTTLGGERLDLADWRGNVVVVNLWASWCPPCRAESGALEKAYDATKADGVEFVGIVSGGKDSVDNAKAFVRKFGISYPSVFDKDNSVVLAFRGQLPPAAIPTTLVLDREGRVAARTLGPVDYSLLRGMIDPVLREKA
jgi:thiol-disulfide isomerase/thioredoxin